MNYVISIIEPNDIDKVVGICNGLGLRSTVVLHGHGTAVRSMLDILGIESNEKRIIFAVANEEKTRQLIYEEKRQLYIGIPGHGFIVSVPIKSVGGGKTMAYLNGSESFSKISPKLNPEYELLVAIANVGRTDSVMNAARSAGATGGTVLHGKGTDDPAEARFFNVSIAKEKEIILIVVKASLKKQIMQEILQKAGPDSKAGTILFSMPVSDIAGFGIFEDTDFN